MLITGCVAEIKPREQIDVNFQSIVLLNFVAFCLCLKFESEKTFNKTFIGFVTAVSAL
jgi:hypothetical protein